MRTTTVCVLAMVLAMAMVIALPEVQAQERPRAREAGIVVGTMPTGTLNAIVDVPGVAVGHATVIEGAGVRTGVTAILPHQGNPYFERVPAGLFVANGYGKLLGVTQLRELGELETPILLTCTLCVWQAADTMADWLLALDGMQSVRSINPVVGETNDGFLNDIRAMPLRPEHVRAALESASTTNVQEGAIGAGTGTVAFGWKGGIGTSSRVTPAGRVVGVLVQSNFGGSLVVDGVPVGRSLPDPASLSGGVEARAVEKPVADGDGSIMVVVATDAPLDARQLERLAARAITGLARTGSSMSNGSGDYVIAFSSAGTVRRHRGDAVHEVAMLDNGGMDDLFVAVAEATEEAILNSLFKAEGMRGERGAVPALPVGRVLELLAQ